MTESDKHLLRKTLGQFLTGVTIVTTITQDGEPLGFTANSFTSVSLEPPLLLVCIAKNANCSDVFIQSNHFAINILAETQKQLSNTFASPIEDRYENVDWITKATGSPIFNDTVGWLDCNTHQVVDAGDHFILLGEVVAFDQSPQLPLGYFQGNYFSVGMAQKALVAIGDKEVKTSIGIVIDRNRSIYLVSNEDNKLDFPRATATSDDDAHEQLDQYLAELGLSLDEKILFSVVEDETKGALAIYYRCHGAGKPKLNDGKFYDFEQIPWDDLATQAISMMVRRYIQERNHDVFGVYFGNEISGRVAKTKTKTPYKYKIKFLH